MTNHTRVVSVSKEDLIVGSSGTEELVDPATLIGPLPQALLPFSDTLVVKIWDEHNSVMYAYSAFMMKHYRITDGMIRFGAKRLKLAGMSIVVGIRIECEDLRSLEEPLD
jgi:hypothetical protein